MTAPTPNAALAYAVLDQIDAHPETWNQGTWDCGTAACFAGWAVRLSGGKVDPLTFDSYLPIVTEGLKEIVGLTVNAAAKLLLRSDCYAAKRDGEEGEHLFASYNTRDDLGRLVAEIFGPRPDGSEGGNVTDGGESS